MPTVMSSTMVAVVVIVDPGIGPRQDSTSMWPLTNPLYTRSLACFPTSVNSGGRAATTELPPDLDQFFDDIFFPVKTLVFNNIKIPHPPTVLGTFPRKKFYEKKHTPTLKSQENANKERKHAYARRQKVRRKTSTKKGCRQNETTTRTCHYTLDGTKEKKEHKHEQTQRKTTNAKPGRHRPRAATFQKKKGGKTHPSTRCNRACDPWG